MVQAAVKLKNLKNILTTNKLPLVSIDFNHNSSSSVFDYNSNTSCQMINFVEYCLGMIMNGDFQIE